MNGKQRESEFGEVDDSIRRWELPEAESHAAVGEGFASIKSLFVPSRFGAGIGLAVLERLLESFERKYKFRSFVQLPAEVRSVRPELRPFIHFALYLKQRGILADLRQPPTYNDEPHLFRFESVLQNERNSAFHGLGHSLVSEQNALVASLGEAFERYCFRHFVPSPGTRVDAAYDDLRGSAIDPRTVVGVSDELRYRGGIHPSLRPLTAGDVFRWVRGWSLTQERPSWMPLQLITGTARFDALLQETGEPLIRLPVSTGAAAGVGRDDSLYRAVCELIERDAYMITYLNRIPPPKVEAGYLPSELVQLTGRFERYDLRAELFRVPTDIPCHVAMAIIRPTRHGGPPFFSLGLKADLDFSAAARGALSEALNMRLGSRRILETLVPSRVPQPDESDRIGQWERLHIWLIRKDLIPQIEFLWRGPSLAPASLPVFLPTTATYHEKLSFLVRAFQQRNLEIVYIENTIPELRSGRPQLPWNPRSFFAVAPSLQPMHLRERIPYFSGARLGTVPVKLGYPPAEPLNTLPHPIP